MTASAAPVFAPPPLPLVPPAPAAPANPAPLPPVSSENTPPEPLAAPALPRAPVPTPAPVRAPTIPESKAPDAPAAPGDSTSLPPSSPSATPAESPKDHLRDQRFIIPEQKSEAPAIDPDEDSSSILDIDEESSSPPSNPDQAAAAVAPAVGQPVVPASSETNPELPAASEGTETVAAGDAADLVVARPAGEPAPAAEVAVAPKVPAPLTALAAAGVLGGVSLFFGYRLTHPAPAAAPAVAAPVAARPAEPVYTPPKVTFADEHVVIAGETSPASPAISTPAAAPIPIQQKPVVSTPSGDAAHNDIKWSFRGEAFDLMTGEPVFAAKLSLLDEKGVVVGSAETGTNGRYELTVPGGSVSGYQLKIDRPDYLEHCIDQGAATGALRQATPDERTVLIHAAHGRPWIGKPGQAEVHDLALIPKSSEPQ